MRPSNRPPRQHHYIPIFYLKRWAGADKKVCQFSRPHKEVVTRRVHPKATGHMDRLYEVRGLPEHLAQQVEQRFFSPVDSAAADALAALESGVQNDGWNTRIRSGWMSFLLSLMMRCPEDIQALRTQFERDWSSTNPYAEERYAHARGPNDPPTFRDFLEQLPVAQRDMAFFDILMGLIQHQDLGNVIVNFHWANIEVPSEGHEFLTSDRGLIITPLGRSDAHLALPIGPRRLFLASRSKELIEQIRRRPGKDLVRVCNQRVVEGAQKFVYGRSDAQEMYVRRRFGADRQQRVAERIHAQNFFRPLDP